MRSVTIYLSDEHDPTTDPKKELDGLKIFGSNYCRTHRTSVMLVRPKDHDVDVVCALSLLRDMIRTIEELASEPEG